METPDIGSVFNSGNDPGITSDRDRPDTGPPNPLPQQTPPVYYCIQAPNLIHGTGMAPQYAYHSIGPNMMFPMTFRPRSIPDIPGDPNVVPASMPVNMTPCFRNGVPGPHLSVNYGEMRYPAFGADPNYQFTYQHHNGPPGVVNQTSESIPCPVNSPISGHESPEHFKERQERDTILSPTLTDCVGLVKDGSGSSAVSCGIRGDSECSGFRGKKNKGKKKNDGWMNKQCTFCKMTGKPTQVYQGHLCKNNQNEVTCPALMQTVCPCCFKTGKNAHTLQECEVFMTQMKNMMISVVRDTIESQNTR